MYNLSIYIEKYAKRISVNIKHNDNYWATDFWLGAGLNMFVSAQPFGPYPGTGVRKYNNKTNYKNLM